MGILGASDLEAFIFGFLILYILLTLIFMRLSVDGFNVRDLIMHEGIVNVPIPVKHFYRGEIVVNIHGTNKFVVAAAFDEIYKPIPKNTKVIIIDFADDDTALVSTEMKLASKSEMAVKLENSWIKFINRITPKGKVTGICMICFAQLIAEKNAFTCPACTHVAHNTHIMPWVKIKGYCPTCRESLTIKKNKIVIGKNDTEIIISKKI